MATKPKKGLMGQGKATESNEQVSLPPLDIRRIRITLVGDSPLICHAWSNAARRSMLDKQMKRPKQAREAKDPNADFIGSIYILEGDPSGDPAHLVCGFPATAFKSAAVDACSHIEGITKVQARGSFHIEGDMVVIQGTPTSREDMVKIAMGTADIRYRGQFKEWRATINIRFNASVLRAEQIIHLFNVGGFAIGIGEWRPQRDGSFGMFHVQTNKD